MKIKINSCPYCNSLNVVLSSNTGYDLYSNLVTNFFIYCEDCTTSIKSRDLSKMIYLWNNYNNEK